MSAAGWLAGTGAGLLLVASVIVVASRWESIPAGARFSGLVAALIAAYSAAEAGRRRFPTTSTALAVLAATITAPVGVAAAATLEQPWPVCVLVGGLAALAATELQSRRWRVPALKVATVVAFALAAIGASALTGVPAPLLGAIGAATALAFGAIRRSVALACAVGLAPALTLLAEAGIGSGTLERVGAVGDVLSWSAPVSGAIAAIVIGITAGRKANLPLALAAVATFASGLVTGLVAGEVAGVVWLCLPAVALLALESTRRMHPESVWRRLAAAAPWIAVPSTAAGVLVPIVLAAHRVDGNAVDVVWTVPLLLTGLALLATSTGSARSNGTPWWVAASLLGAAGAVVGAATITAVPLALVAFAVLVLGAAILGDDRPAYVGADDGHDRVLGVGRRDGPRGRTDLGGGGTRRRVRRRARCWRCRSSIAPTAGSGWSGSRSSPASRCTRSPAATAGPRRCSRPSGSSCSAWHCAPRCAIVPVGVAEVAVALSFLDGHLGWWNVALLAGLAGACGAAAGRSLRSPWAHLASGCLVAAGTLALYVAGLDSTAIVLVLAALAVGLTGLGAWRDDLGPIDTAALVAGAFALGASLGGDAVFVSLTIALLGAQGIVLGTTQHDRALLLAGAAGVGGAAVSLWWTTGTNELVIAAIAPYGATGVDVAVGVTGLALLGVGVILRRAFGQSSWFAYGPGLGLLATWLLSAQVQPGTDWATLGALALGVIATGVGGVRRLGAPLIAGTLTIGATCCISAGPRLAEAPTWAWIAVGGVLLLALAALVERSERPLLPTGDPERASIVESFMRGFE